ncbi:MAG: hypothetical protein ACRD1T_06095, partial [Acidimicrobiia bacterium]
DWKVSGRLTLNLGLRYEYEGATTERDNRNVRGFIPDASLAIAAAAEAAYARNPIPEISPSAFRVRGGLGFASDSERGFYNADTNNFQPRVGLAYQWNDKTVVRGGWAIYAVPAIIAGVRQNGFSQDTQIVPTLDVGLTFRATLANPFPDGVADPAGASRGPNTFLGRTLDRLINDINYRNGQSMRWAVSVQRELPGQWVAEAAYVGNRGYDLTTVDDNNTGIELNGVLRGYLSTLPFRDEAVNSFLTANVPNPFEGLLPGTGQNGATVQRQQLLRPFPQFANIRGFAFDGSSEYHAGQFRLERRFTAGYTLLASYTYSKFTEKVSKLNPTDTEYEERPAEADIPHRLVVSGIWELPFGRDRKIGSDWNGLMNGLLGGWSTQVIWQTQSGRPITWGSDVYYNGDPRTLKTDFSDVSNPVFDTSNFYFNDPSIQRNGVPDPALQRGDRRIQLVHHLRTFPTRMKDFRRQGLSLWDISLIKRVNVTNRVRMQFHVEFLNAFNTPVFNAPTLSPTSSLFGRVESQDNLPRDIQLAAKIVF